jgi:hypothetical protein
MNDVSATLRELHDQYVEQVNMAVSEDRPDIVQALTDEFATVLLTERLDAGTAQNSCRRDRTCQSTHDPSLHTEIAAPVPAPAPKRRN